MDALRNYLSALQLMFRGERPPTFWDARRLPGGGKVGRFWHSSKSERRCERPPYDRLLNNPVLRDDYHLHKATQECGSEAQLPYAYTKGNSRGEGRCVTVLPIRSEVDVGKGEPTDETRCNETSRRRDGWWILALLQALEEVR